MTFAHSYVSYPVCCPSRATYLSGQYAHNHHVMGLYPPTGGYIRFDRCNSLPVWLERRRLRDRAHRQVHERLRHRRCRPTSARLDRVVRRRWTGRPTGCGATRSTRTATATPTAVARSTRTRGSTRRTSTGGKAVELHRAPRALEAPPFFLSVAFLAPHHEMPVRARRDRPPGAAGAARRAATLGDDAAADIAAPSTRRNLADKPRVLCAAGRSTPSRSQGSRRGTARSPAQSLLAVDDAVAGDRQRRCATPASSTTPTSCSRPTTATCRASTTCRAARCSPTSRRPQVPLLLRGPGIPRDRVSEGAGRQHRPGSTILQVAHARAGKPAGRALAAPVRARPGSGARARAVPARDRRGALRPGARPGRRTASPRRAPHPELPRGAHEPLAVRGVPRPAGASCTTWRATPTSCTPTPTSRATRRSATRCIAC